MDIGEILATSWRTIWKHKVIPAFGLLSQLLPALAGLLLGGYYYFMDPLALIKQPSNFLVFFALLMVMIVLSLLSTGLAYAGVMQGTLRVDGGAARISLGELWTGSLSPAVRIIALLLLLEVGILALMFIPMALGVLTAGIAFLCFLPLVVLLIPLGLLIYLCASLTTAVIVADGMGVFQALRRAWELLRRHFWELVLMALILYMVQFIISTVITLPLSFFQGAFLPVFMDQADPSEMFRFFGVLMAVSMPLSILAQGLGLSYVNAAWMLTYLRMKGPAAAQLPVQA